MTGKSSAGKKYKIAFENKLGFNPYAASGFVPNFIDIENNPLQDLGKKTGIITGDVLRGKEYQNVLSYLAGTEKPVQTRR